MVHSLESSASNSSSDARVVLLLDLDCFYAQCETVRLGLDPSVPLCLLQWNSSLAVNYPARERYNLKRGASFQEIRQVSGGKCIALHLPVVSNAELEPSKQKQNSTDLDNFSNTSQETSESIEEAYDREFKKSPEERRALFDAEKNRMRHAGEGKASLDRYRLASTRIFEVMMDSLEEHVGKGRYILEKASIDELYVDVTKHCYDFDTPAWRHLDDNHDHIQERDSDHISTTRESRSTATTKSEPLSLEEMASNKTVVCTKNMIQIDPSDGEVRALQRGCTIARGMRKAVFDKLAFTLSAGVSTSKLIAKLCASYGKPNGQAVAFPDAIPHLLNETKIKKTRNLGGKIGDAVLRLLPQHENTMGSIARILTLQQLSSSLGLENGRMVWNYSNGIDNEPVKQTKGALTKSITSFKSFSDKSKEGVRKWISLLSTDLLNRVHLDSSRNNRFPTTCVIQYYLRDENGKRQRSGKSVRIAFPNGPETCARNASFMKKVEELLCSKCDITNIARLGLSAVNFQEKAKNSIGNFFDSQTTTKSTTRSIPRKIPLQNRCGKRKHTEKGADTKSPFTYKFQNRSDKVVENQAKRQVHVLGHNGDKDSDLIYAKKLQAMYDKEDKILSSIEQKRDSIDGIPPRRQINPCRKKDRIDNFFKPKRK